MLKFAFIKFCKTFVLKNGKTNKKRVCTCLLSGPNFDIVGEKMCKMKKFKIFDPKPTN